MAKKKRPKTDKEWEDWGEQFGETMEKRGKDFAEEVEGIGDRICSGFRERRRVRWEHREARMHFFWPLGLIWPIITSVFGIIVLLIGIFFLDWINMHLNSGFILSVSSFLFANIPIFFGLSILFGYARFLRRMAPKAYWIIAPIINSTGITFFFWIAAWALSMINRVVKSALADNIFVFLSTNLLEIFLVFVVLGYIIAIFWWMVKMTKGE